MKCFKLLSLMFLLVLLASMVSAFEMPWLVRGEVKVNGFAYEFQEIQVQHVINGRIVGSVDVQTYNDGTYQFDVTKFDNRVLEGDKVCVVACSNSASCKKCVTKDSSGGKYIAFNIVDSLAIVTIFGVVIMVGGLIILGKKWWFKGILGIIRFWYRKEPSRAKKIIKKLEQKALAGKYK